MASHINKSLQLSALCVAIACAHTSAWAIESLEKLDDEMLAEATGEGVAFLPENFSMRMNGADAANSGVGTYDTGYVRFIPVGPLKGKNAAGADYTYNTSGGEVYDQSGKVIQKADIYLYGLNLSQSNVAYGAERTAANWDMSFGRAIDSWGTASNPWVFKTVTEKVHQFTAKNGTAGADVTYLNLEAPLYKTLTSATTNGSTYNDVSALSAKEQSAYNLRMSLYADAFMRDANTAEGTTTATAKAGLSNQLRVNAVWDGFGINGSNIKIFRTQDGVLTGGRAAGVASGEVGLSKAYNNTLGMAATLRLNSGPTHNLRGSESTTSVGQWVSYKANTIANWKDRLSDADITALKANTFNPTGSGVIDNKSIIIADGTGTAASGTVLWNGEEAYRGTNLALANPDNPTYSNVIRSYVPLGNSQGNNNIDNQYTATSSGATLKPGTSGSGREWINRRVFISDSDFIPDAICGTPAGIPADAGHAGNPGHCLTQEGFRIISAEVTSSTNWTLPADAKKSVLRINAATMLNGTNYAVDTPALGGSDPTFDDPSKGIFLYGLNANLVLGSLYQPLVLDASGGNFSIEVTRVPNSQAIYRQIYTRYSDIDPAATVDNGVVYLGSTCNVYRCSADSSGNAVNIALAGSNYQTNTATHGSISIGSTVYDAAKNQLFADKGIESFGVSFGELNSETGLQSVGRRDYIQTFQTTRTPSSPAQSHYEIFRDAWEFCALGVYCRSWVVNNYTGALSWNGKPQYFVSGTGYGISCPGKSTNPGDCSTTGGVPPAGITFVKQGSGDGRRAFYQDSLYNERTSWTNGWTKTDTVNPSNGKTTRFNQNTNYQILGLKTGCLNNCGIGGIGHTIAGIGATGTASTPTDLTSSRTPSNNLGSAVIDGLLIQHFKMTTTGLN